MWVTNLYILTGLDLSKILLNLPIAYIPVCISVRASASAVKLCGPFSCLHASAAQHLCRLVGCIQCAVTPMKPFLCAVQQSVVVLMNSTSRIATLRFFFISCVAFSILLFIILRAMTFAFGCRWCTWRWKPSSSATLRGCRPWTTKSTIWLSTLFCDTCLPSQSFTCLGAWSLGSSSFFLFRVVSFVYLSRCLSCFL